MKKRIILLSGVLLISFFMVTSVAAQEKPKEVTKAKSEMVKKDAPSKCASCPSMANCSSSAAVKAREENGNEAEGKTESSATTREKKKAKKK